MRLKLTAHLDQDANGDILRVSVTNNSVFEVRHKFVGMILKDGSEHLIREWWGSDPPPFQPRGQIWENHPFPLKFRAHESNRNGRIDFARDDLRYFVVRTAHGKKEYKAPIRKMTKKQQAPDPRATNPRYEGLRLSDAVRILTRPKSPDARKALDRIQGKTGAK